MQVRIGMAAALLALSSLALSSCSGPSDHPQNGAQQAAAVSYVTVREEAVALTIQLPGRTSPYETSEVRPQVNGLVRARLFAEGDYVRQGQPLYRIDAAPYEAQVASARAGLARARASVSANAALARRYGELVKINAISRQEYENAVAVSNQTGADVAAQQAALRSAQIDLERTTIRAPISGRIGTSAFTTGALVTAAQADPLATIQRLDPIYVDIQESSADLLRIREQIMAGQVSGGGDARVRLRLETGSLYPIEGTLRFADVTVDPATGSQTIRAQFANPNGLLLPGMFVRAEFVEGIKSRGIVVPQRAVSRDARGNPTVMVVGKDNKAEQRTIAVDRTIGTGWLVTSGLKAGDKVIVEGLGMLQPGSPVKAQPWAKNSPTPASTAQAK